MFVDSGAWIALFSARDGNHEAAHGAFSQAVARRITLLTTNLVIAEVHRLLLFRAGIGAALRALERIDASPRVKIELATAAHHDAARAWLGRFADQELTYADAVSFAVMEAAGCKTAVSFDSDFWIAGFTPWQP